MTEKPLLTYLPCLFVLFLWVLLRICLSFSALTSLPQPHRSCNMLLLRGFPKSCRCPLCPQQHITLPLPVLLPQTHRQYFSAEAKPSSGTSKSHVLLRSASLEGCEAEAQLHKAGQGVPMDGTWLNHKGRLCLCSLT